MDIQNLVPVDFANQRVLLTAQVADVFNCPPKRINDNFTRSKEYFDDTVHYFKLTGLALRQFKSYAEKIGVAVAPSAMHLYLWTYQGCVRHCKMINTPEAWAMFDALEKHYFNPATHVAPVETSLFPDEPVKAKKKRKPLPEYAVVYSALLDNALVKIGLTTDFNRRIKEVRKETGLDVEDVFTTNFMPLDDARKLESTVKAKFFDKNKGGEFYDAPFEEVKAAILAEDKVNKLLALADRLPDSDEKTRLVLQAASLV